MNVTPGPTSALVAARLRRLRIQRRLSARQLAAMITGSGYYITRETVAKYEVGKKANISVDLLAAACRALKVPAEGLMGEGACPTCRVNTPAPPYACDLCGYLPKAYA